MTPDINSILAISTAQYAVLSALDTGGAFACLEPNCCSMFVDEEWTKLIMITGILQITNATGVLPTIDDPCCPLTCESVTVNGTPGSGSFTDLAVTDDLTVGDDAAITGDLSAGTLALGGSPSIAQIRRGTGTLVGGTLVIAAAWVTATTRIVATYTQASAAGEANISIGTKTAGVSFVVNGEGTNTFDWIAVV